MTQQLGKYQLIRKLATGGMAEVFLAKAAGPMGFEKTLVLKRILPHLAEDPAFVDMFLAEAKLAAQLNHPNIVQIFDFGEADGAYFLAMEYIDGPNLRVLLKKANAAGIALPPALCARLIASACEGLAFAHDFQDPSTGEALGLIHRDISPDNILVSRQGAVKVVDFGIAKAAGQSHKTQSGIIKGKLSYMPPEQVRAKTLDRRVDVYALGVVFYELLTRHKPFEAPTDASLMQAILFESQVPASQHRPDLPEAVQRILERALSKDREQRYPDCLSLAAELEEFILSVGKPVTTQQIVQLVAQVAPNTDAPMPTPQPGTPRSGGGSGPRASTTPVHTPAPVQSGTGAGTRSGLHPPSVGNTTGMTAPEDGSSEELSARTVPLDTGEMPAATTQVPELPRSKNRWIPVTIAAVLLATLGAFALLRTSHGPESPPPPQVAQLPTPVPTPPPPTPAPTQPPEAVQEKPPEQAQTPPPEENAVPPGAPPISEGREQKNSSNHKTPSHQPKAKAAAPVGKGKIVFRVRPYATVILSGRNLGQTPLDPVETPAGKYTVQFINDDLKKKKTEAFELKPGETRTFKINLESED